RPKCCCVCGVVGRKCCSTWDKCHPVHLPCPSS
uniref:Conotoxin Cltx-4 n=1 Tax=Californiconus californicus TaxID=1736779 RepID=CUX4_CONCL|nr:RecName: Full=Conotoxin Cltx-4; AltName: Full=CalXXIXA [Californiconus californicus]